MGVLPQAVSPAPLQRPQSLSLLWELGLVFLFFSIRSPQIILRGVFGLWPVALRFYLN